MADLTAAVAEAVRAERGRILGRLLRLCGSLDAAEEAFQEAALAALHAWRGQVPANPGAWLMTAARNAAWDARRRRSVAEAKAPLLAGDEMASPDTVDAVSDDSLRLLFTCCHPALPVDGQVALTLKVVAGFSTGEIARAFLCSEAAVSQRILRARQLLGERAAGYETPGRAELPGRVSAVLGVVYALFNEGHTSHRGPWMRLDLQAEALRLARKLCDLLPIEPEVFGALALFALGAARAGTRVDEEGLPILLAAQDRSRWSRELIREGLVALRRARTLGGKGPLVLQAQLAALHATASTWESTDWAAIVATYDALAAIDPSPVVALNRAIAISMHQGPAAGLASLAALERPLAGYHLFYAARADMQERGGGDPRPDLERALALATNAGERRLLGGRLARARPR